MFGPHIVCQVPGAGLSLTNALTGILTESASCQRGHRVAKEVSGAKLLYFIGGSMELYIMENNRNLSHFRYCSDIHYVQILLHEYSLA